LCIIGATWASAVHRWQDVGTIVRRGGGGVLRAVSVQPTDQYEILRRSFRLARLPLDSEESISQMSLSAVYEACCSEAWCIEAHEVIESVSSRD
jgi:hypothetical protein